MKLHANTEKFKIGRGVRQGDGVSPKLFTTILESVFKKLDWSGMRMKINGKFLNHIRCADDILLIATDLNQLQTLMSQLNDESSKLG